MSLASPTTKPRLPSPPPFTEVQIGPKSPGIGSTTNAPTTETDDREKLEERAVRRVRPGTKAVDMASGPPLKPLTEVDSAFQLQEHLKSLYYHHTRPSDPSANHTTPLTRTTALAIAKPPNTADRALWLYELCRLLVIKADQLIVHFFTDNPPCSAATCPEMRASEWQYLCAVHEPPKPCCAIDYCCHTLDWAASTLASQKHFPSRLTLGNDATGGSQAGVRHLTNIMRRVYRIFAHAWFQHRLVFWEVENAEGLYVLFKTVCDVYGLIPEENYTIPPEAEGLTTKDDEDEKREGKAILKKDHSTGGEEGPGTKPLEDTDTIAPTPTTTTLSTGATTRRHKATPSFSTTVSAIAEGDENDDAKTVSSASTETPARHAAKVREEKEREKEKESGAVPVSGQKPLEEEPNFEVEEESPSVAGAEEEGLETEFGHAEGAEKLAGGEEEGEGQ